LRRGWHRRLADHPPRWLRKAGRLSRHLANIGAWWSARSVGWFAAAPAAAAERTFHTFIISEVYSNADGSVQFIELRENLNFNGQHFLVGHALTASNAAGTDEHVFTFPTNLPSSATASRRVLARPLRPGCDGRVLHGYGLPGFHRRGVWRGLDLSEGPSRVRPGGEPDHLLPGQLQPGRRRDRAGHLRLPRGVRRRLLNAGRSRFWDLSGMASRRPQCGLRWRGGA
jgi:hypothetical protein